MTLEQREIIQCRLECLSKAMRLQGTGADIHAVGNIRVSIQRLEYLVNETPISFEEALGILIKLEKTVISFFRLKYAALR